MSLIRSAAVLVTLFLLCVTGAAAGRMVNFVAPSASLTSFWQKPISIDGFVLLPDSYDGNAQARYPVVYWFPGFGREDQLREFDRGTHGAWDRAFRDANHEMIVVFVNPLFEGLYTAFADSANLGPWGRAFTTEIVPYIEANYRATGRRYVAGHSSGGWTSLWLQVTYPKLFAGAWAYAPDPVDFRDWMGVDLTSPKATNYYKNGNVDLTSCRKGLVDMCTHKDFVDSFPEQFKTFNYVFSPPTTEGPAARLFDLVSGDINPEVASFWEQHYDISTNLKSSWSVSAGDLRGKVHVIVGDHDTFHLDAPVRLLQADLAQLDPGASFTYVPNANHWEILEWDGGFERHIVEGAK